MLKYADEDEIDKWSEPYFSYTLIYEILISDGIMFWITWNCFDYGMYDLIYTYVECMKWIYDWNVQISVIHDMSGMCYLKYMMKIITVLYDEKCGIAIILKSCCCNMCNEGLHDMKIVYALCNTRWQTKKWIWKVSGKCYKLVCALHVIEPKEAANC